MPEEEGGIPWIATNTDWTIPQARGVAPGNGTLVSAVHTAIGRLATVAGKPEVPIFEEAVARFGARHPLFLGDRLDTDILGANRAGIPSALVLTGIDRPKHVLAAPAGSQPTFILGDLRELHEPYPEVRVARRRARACAVRRVRIDGPDVRIRRAGDRPIDLLRAGAAAIWATGRAIFGFRVPERALRRPVPPARDRTAGPDSAVRAPSARILGAWIRDPRDDETGDLAVAARGDRGAAARNARRRLRRPSRQAGPPPRGRARRHRAPR